LKEQYTSAAGPIARLIEEFSKLPGIGPKSAQRIAYYLLQMPSERAESLAGAIVELKKGLSLCPVCFNISDITPCSICVDIERDTSKICVIEEPSDIVPLERTKIYKGLYHVLHGVINPAEGIGPEMLKIRELMERLQNGSVTEVIIATNPNTEGEATCMYLQSLIAPLGIKVSRLARGLPYGGDLEYADDVTISRALEGRQEF
jgi:recombination protein RecR